MTIASKYMYYFPQNAIHICQIILLNICKLTRVGGWMSRSSNFKLIAISCPWIPSKNLEIVKVSIVMFLSLSFSEISFFFVA